MTADDADWMTVTEIARHLGRPPATVKYWRDTHRESLDERSDEYGHATYSLATFREISVLMNRRTERSEIRRILTARRERPGAPVESFEADVIARLDRLLEIAERTARAVERIADHLISKEN